MLNPFGLKSSASQRPFIQRSVPRGTPGAYAMQSGKNTFWVVTEPNPALKQPTAETPAAVTTPAPVAAPAPASPSPSTAPGNPALSIPGVDVRLTGENLGIKSKNSSARRSGQLNKGTSRLTIPRSSGANSLNFG